jgi:hypothetical protein
LIADTGSDAAPLVFDRRGDGHFEACTGLPRAPYIVAVASDRELPPLPPSLYIDRSDIDGDKVRAFGLEAQIRNRDARLAECDARLAEFGAHLVDLDARILERNVRLEERDVRIADRDARIVQLVEEHDRALARIAEIGAELAQVKADVRAANERTMRVEQSREHATEQAAALQKRLDDLAGSFRGFMRGYLPRLYRHLRGG